MTQGYDPNPGFDPVHYGYASVADLEQRFLDDCNSDTYDLLYAIDQGGALLETCVNLAYEVLGLWESLENPKTMPFSPWCRDLLEALRHRAPGQPIGPEVTPWRFGYWLAVRMYEDGHGRRSGPGGGDA